MLGDDTTRLFAGKALAPLAPMARLARGWAMSLGASGAGLLRRARIPLTALIVAAALALIALEAGLYTRTVTLNGPFKDEGGQAVSAPIPDWILRPNADTAVRLNASRLRLWVEGAEYTTPHALHDDVRAGNPGTFSHWGGAVYFAPPPGAANDAGLDIVLRYTNKLPSVYGALGGFLVLAAIGAVAWGAAARRHAPFLLSLPAHVTTAVALTLAASAIAYATIALWAWLAGWALPTTAPVALPGVGPALAAGEPHVASLLLLLAAAGAAAHWAAQRFGAAAAVERAERRTQRTLGWAGPPAALCLAVLCVSASWAGLVQPGNTGDAALGGLVPFSDSMSYFLESFTTVEDGSFGPLGSRRPLAQAFRSSLMIFAGMNYPAMVMLQTLCVVAAILFAANSVRTWLGPWAALGFFAIAFLAARPYLTTALTESLGLFWSLCAIPFFVQSFRRGSAVHAVAGLGLLWIALLARMGSMFTPLALILWIVWQFGATLRRKAAIGAAALAALAAVSLLNFALAKLHVDDVALVGGNLSYTLCGLSIGDDWDSCLTTYPDEAARAAASGGDERGLSSFLYQRAFENIVDRPRVIAARVIDGTLNFAHDLPATLTQGYFYRSLAVEPGAAAFLLAALAGLLHLALANRARLEISFWLLFWASVLLSAGFVYFDDGRRAMIAVYPLMALFLARGLAARPAADAGCAGAAAEPGMKPARALAVLGVILAAIAATPTLAHLAFRAPALPPAPDSSDVLIVQGAPALTGFLVVDDGAPLDRATPSIRLSDFRNIVAASRVETYQTLISPAPPPTPFAFIATPPAPGMPSGRYNFIAPPEVLARRDVRAWRFTVEPYGVAHFGEPYWDRVIAAEPLTD